MHRYRLQALSVVALGLSASIPVAAASRVRVDRAAWDGGATLPGYAEMHVYVPDNLRPKPAIVVSAHSCGGSAAGQMRNMDHFQATTDRTGDFILILPDNPGQSCWDVGSEASLTRDGGGDTHAVAQMVRYALATYDADVDRVYMVGGSSGAMLTQATLGVYPDMFMAGAARAGLPSGDGWAGSGCNGGATKTGQQWGDIVRAMNSDYGGHRPRVALFHGDADSTISYNCHTEGIKQWINVLGLSENASSEESVSTRIASYQVRRWVNDCGVVAFEEWTAPGKGHSMDYEEEAWLKFLGLEVVGGPDPEADCVPPAPVMNAEAQDAGIALGGAGGAGGLGAADAAIPVAAGAPATGGAPSNEPSAPGGAAGRGGDAATVPPSPSPNADPPVSPVAPASPTAAMAPSLVPAATPATPSGLSPTGNSGQTQGASTGAVAATAEVLATATPAVSAADSGDGANGGGCGLIVPVPASRACVWGLAGLGLLFGVGVRRRQGV